VIQASLFRAVVEAEVGEESEVEVEVGEEWEVGLRLDLKAFACVPAVRTVHPMWWAHHAINKPALNAEVG